MQHKCEIKRKIQLFISSSMAGGINSIWRERRRAIKAFLDRWPYFNSFFVEASSYSQGIEEICKTEVRKADLVIFILQKETRKGIELEVNEAIKDGKRMIAFIHSGKSDKKIKELINDIRIKGNCTTSYFNDTEDLIDKMELDLIKQIVNTYADLPYTLMMYEKKLEEKVGSPDETREETR